MGSLVFKINHYSLGQWCVLQDLESVANPEQGDPPLRGEGFVQVRDRLCVPPPQFFEHSPKSPYAAQLPLTEYVNLSINI